MWIRDGEKYDVSKKFAREWPIQVEIEEVSSILPRSLSRNLCEFQRLSSGEIDGERRKVVLRIVKKFLATRYHHFLLIFALILSTFHASFLRSPSSQRHRRSWRPRSEARKKDIFFSRMLGTSDRSVDGSAFWNSEMENLARNVDIHEFVDSTKIEGRKSQTRRKGKKNGERMRIKLDSREVGRHNAIGRSAIEPY